MATLGLIRRLIPLLVIAILGTAGVLALGRSWLSPIAPVLYEGLAPPLVGVVNTTPPAAPTWANIEAGRTQAAASATFDSAIPQRAFVVRAFNDMLWWSAGASYMASRTLMTGRRGNL